MAVAGRDSETSAEPVTEHAAPSLEKREIKVRKMHRTRQEGSGTMIAMNDHHMPLSPADEIAAVHLMLDRHSVPRDHAGQELSLQGRIQEFAFMAAAGAVKLAQRVG
jgi:hypothetical protein